MTSANILSWEVSEMRASPKDIITLCILSDWGWEWMGIWNLTGGQFNAHKLGINTLFDWTEAEQLTPLSTAYKPQTNKQHTSVISNNKIDDFTYLDKMSFISTLAHSSIGLESERLWRLFYNILKLKT